MSILFNRTALSGWLPRILFFCASLAAVSGATIPNYSVYAELLEAYVTPAGVRYDDWFANKAHLGQLNDFLSSMADVEVEALDREAQKAFYINLYNAAMLQAVFRVYPIETVRTIGPSEFSVFSEPFIQQKEVVLSLDAIEKDILLIQYFDPRIHFAVNCASESCPPLRAEPYTGAELQAQLEEQTRAFAQSDRAVRVDVARRVNIYSSLFDWYAKDFGVANPGVFLNKYREDLLDLGYVIEWIPYDWTLNQVED